MRVLVLDQSQPVRSRLVGRLQELGHDVVGECAGLADGLSAAGHLAPEAVVTDLQFEDSRGLDIVLALRANIPTALLVIVTNDLHYRRACLANGADDFLDKSTELDGLGAALQRQPR
jgi:DNA-binding NarL/FixJ family response regulator